MSQRNPDILTRTKNISIGAREEAVCLPFSFCPQESSEIAYFLYPSFLLKGPRQGITAFLKLIFSFSCSDSNSLSPSSGNSAREGRGGTVVASDSYSPIRKDGCRDRIRNLISLSFKSLPTFCHFLRCISAPSMIN